MEEEKNQLHLHLWIPTTLSKLETRKSKSTKFSQLKLIFARSEITGLKSSDISKKNRTNVEKWTRRSNALARLAGKRHLEKYSDYVYTPKKKDHL